MLLLLKDENRLEHFLQCPGERRFRYILGNRWACFTCSWGKPWIWCCLFWEKKRPSSPPWRSRMRLEPYLRVAWFSKKRGRNGHLLLKTMRWSTPPLMKLSLGLLKDPAALVWWILRMAGPPRWVVWTPALLTHGCRCFLRLLGPSPFRVLR